MVRFHVRALSSFFGAAATVAGPDGMVLVGLTASGSLRVVAVRGMHRHTDTVPDYDKCRPVMREVCVTQHRLMEAIGVVLSSGAKFCDVDLMEDGTVQFEFMIGGSDSRVYVPKVRGTHRRYTSSAVPYAEDDAPARPGDMRFGPLVVRDRPGKPGRVLAAAMRTVMGRASL